MTFILLSLASNLRLGREGLLVGLKSDISSGNSSMSIPYLDLFAPLVHPAQFAPIMYNNYVNLPYSKALIP